MYSRHSGFWLLTSVFFFSACSRDSTLPPSRVAILRFENLSSDVSLDWMGRAASEIIAHEIAAGASSVISSNVLNGSPLARSRPASSPGESFERDAALANGANRIVIGQISSVRNRLILDVTERDSFGKTLQAFTLTTPDTANLFGLADAAARRLSPQITPFDSKNNPAIAGWARGLEEPDYTKAEAYYARAVEADPDFASAWLSLAGVALAHGDHAQSQEILTDAQQHAGRFSEVNRARLQLATAQFAGDRAALLAAANQLAHLLPDDPDTLAAVAEQDLASRQFLAAATAFRRLTTVQPDNAPAWNQLGYALMYAGDYDGAMSALRSYQRRLPNDANPLDSQGDVTFAFGRFPEAEKLYDQAAAVNPAFENSADLYKAAVARLMTGDIAGADKKFEAFTAARRSAGDASVPLRTAQWQFLSGRHDQAFSLLASTLASAPPQLKSIALTQMSVWDLQLGRRARALQESSDALKTGAASPGTVIARFASEDARTPAEWSARADRMLKAPQMQQIKSLALAYALYLSHDLAEAEPLWKQLLDRSGPDDSLTPAIYGQILVELHRPQDARPLVARFPIPSSGSQEFLSLVIPQIFETRADAKLPEAEAGRKVFKTLSGGV